MAKPKKSKPKSKPHTLKRLSLKPMRFKDALKLFVSTTKEDLKKAKESEE